MIPPFLEDLPKRWLGKSQELKCYGAEAAANTLARCAVELQEAVTAWLDEELSVAAAAAETGRSERFLRDQVRDGRLKSVRGASPMKIRRGDLLAFHTNSDPKASALELVG